MKWPWQKKGGVSSPFPPPDAEQRDRLLSPRTEAPFGVHPTSSGFYASPRAAEGLSTVLACVQQISSAIASLPCFVYETGPGGRVENTTNPLNRLIATGPNDWQTWPDFVEWFVATCLLRGNALAEIQTDGRGAVTALLPHAWETIGVQMLPSGRLAYDVVLVIGLYSGPSTTGRTRRLLADEVVHLRDRSDDGLIGRSRLVRAAETVGNALAVQEFSGSVYANAATPSGALETDSRLSASSMERLALEFREFYTGPGTAKKALVLD